MKFKKRHKMTKGFSLVEIVIGIAILGIAMGAIAVALTAMNKQKEDARLEASIFQLGKGIQDSVKANPDSFTLSSEYVVYKTNNDDTNHLIIKKNEWTPMLSVANAAGVIAETTANGQGVKGDGSAITDTAQYIQRLKDFWGVKSFQTENTPYIFVAQKYTQTAQGSIPYNDIYVLLLPERIAKPLKTSKALRDRVINNMILVEGRVCELVDTSVSIDSAGGKIIDYTNCKKYASYTTDSNVVTTYTPATQFLEVNSVNSNLIRLDIAALLTAANINYLNEKEVIELKRNIKLLSFSNRSIVLDYFNKSVENVNTYAKNLKDWASIQMAMYENTVAKIGGSFNIDYFISRTDKTSSIDDDYFKIGTNDGEYIATSLFSSAYLARTDCRKAPTADVCWDTDNNIITIRNDKGKKSTLYGIAIKAFNYMPLPANLTRGYYNILAINRSLLDSQINGKETLLDITRSSTLLDGSYTILGIKATDKGVGNPFGDPYRYGFSNIRKYGVAESGTVSGYSWEQNKPDSTTAYAPYTAVINTTFPWIYMKVRPDDNFFGYYESRIVPELR